MQKGKYIYYSPESHYGWKQLKKMFQIMTLRKCIFYGLFIYSLVNSHLSCIHLVSEAYYVPGKNSKGKEI